MEKKVEIGKEVDLDIKVEDGLVKLEFKHEGHGATAGVYYHLKPEYLVEKLTKAIPGELDDQLGVLLLAALKK